jgi:hypothetical protein
MAIAPALERPRHGHYMSARTADDSLRLIKSRLHIRLAPNGGRSCGSSMWFGTHEPTLASQTALYPAYKWSRKSRIACLEFLSSADAFGHSRLRDSYGQLISSEWEAPV